MKKSILFLIMIAACVVVRAQSLSPAVVASSGGYFVNSSSLSFTVAEMTMVQTFSAGSNILTQGFQQDFDFGTFVSEPTKGGVAFDVYPNPSSGNMNIALNTTTNVKVDVRLFDALGKTVELDHFNHSSGANVYAYNWYNLSDGMYMLEVTTTDPVTNVSQRSMKKINIIY
jgi:hypothetical protein